MTNKMTNKLRYIVVLASLVCCSQSIFAAADEGAIDPARNAAAREYLLEGPLGISPLINILSDYADQPTFESVGCPTGEVLLNILDRKNASNPNRHTSVHTVPTDTWGSFLGKIAVVAGVPVDRLKILFAGREQNNIIGLLYRNWSIDEEIGVAVLQRPKAQ
jgi:hypothetical protein